jgi:large conductance mechanosensitive channel
MSEKKGALAEFKDFILQGNVVDLAVAVIIAMFFGAIVKDLVGLILTILAIPGKHPHAFASLSFTIGKGTFQYGNLIQDVITFVLVAAVVFFVVVRPLRMLMEKRRTEPDPESANRPCPYCRSDIPKEATRCAFCTSEVTATV